MKPLTLAFSDQRAANLPQPSFWIDLLRSAYDVRMVDGFFKADLLFYSDWGVDHQRFQGRKVYYTGENMLPDYDECDFGVTSCIRPDDPRHHRVPYYVFATKNPEELLKPPNFDAAAMLRSKTGFCAFIVSNPRAPERNRFFKLLNRKKGIDSAGRHFNNVGYSARDKAEFIAKYKFVLAFENSLTPGYTTEKLTEAMLARAVPIYWGNPEVGRDFNARSFINASDFHSLERLAYHVLRVDSDDQLYLQYLREPWFIDNKIPEVFNMDALRNALVGFIESGVGPGRRTYRKRRLRAHAYQSPFQQTLSSLGGRLDGVLWKMGLRF